jgi:uncharacterized protein YbjT (DUF2867 family)
MGQEKVLVIGGSGHYGRRIVQSLLGAGADVSVLTRNVDRACQVLGSEVEAIEGDLTSPQTRAKALAGATRLVVAVAAYSRKLIRRRLLIERDAVLALLDEATRGGVARVVYLSGYEIREEFVRRLGLLQFARPQLDVEAALADSSLNWTVLGCAPSMEIFFAMMRGDTVIVPGGGPPALPTVSAHDVGQVAAQAVLRDDLTKRRFRLTGPEAVSFPEAARRIGAVWGRQIRFRRIPLTPLRIAAILTKPVTPYLTYIAQAVTLLNNFPQDLAGDVPDDCRQLQTTFDYRPTSLEEEARRRRCPS